MTEELLFTHFLNKYFGAIAIKILAALGAHPVTAGENKAYLFTYNPAAPISNFFAMEVLVGSILVVLFIWTRSRISVDRPGAMQHAFEVVEDHLGEAFTRLALEVLDPNSFLRFEEIGTRVLLQGFQWPLRHRGDEAGRIG